MLDAQIDAPFPEGREITPQCENCHKWQRYERTIRGNCFDKYRHNKGINLEMLETECCNLHTVYEEIREKETREGLEQLQNLQRNISNGTHNA